MNKWCEKEIAEMIEAVSNCDNPEDVCGLFDIILTPREINDMARRLKIVKMLDEGRQYMEIRQELAVGSDVISRVAGQIGYGFRRVHPTRAKRGLVSEKNKYLAYRRGVYYKGVPSIGTMVRQLKK